MWYVIIGNHGGRDLYAKVFTQIFDSSIADDYHVRLVFTDFLTLATSDGVVDMTHESISARTRVPLEIVRRAIEQLESPDNRSRSPDYNGARIIKLDGHRDWGWIIVNYQKYRNIKNEDKRKEQVREAVRRHREKKACNQSVISGNHVKSKSPHKERERDKEKNKEKKTTPTPPSAGESFPQNLNSQEFKAAWESYKTHRKELKKPLGLKASEMLLKKLSAWGATAAILALEESIANGWQGVFAARKENSRNGYRKPPDAGFRAPDTAQEIRDTIARNNAKRDAAAVQLDESDSEPSVPGWDQTTESVDFDDPVDEYSEGD